MISLYTWTTPNGRKISIMLEELGIPYQVHPVHLGQGQQRSADYLAISPNGKIPAIVDHDADGGALSVFESGAILTYLAEQHGRLLPATKRPTSPATNTASPTSPTTRGASPPSAISRTCWAIASPRARR